MMPDENSHTQVALQRLNRTILLGFAAIGLALVFWSVARAGILAREDNPRLVEAELRIQRGRILDRNDVVLAENSGTPARQIRTYPHPNIGPAVGYYSFRHGTAGVEESFDAVLRGETDGFAAKFIRQTLHQPQVGQDVRLTLDAELQETAVTLLNDQTGAILLLDISQPGTADLLVAVSQPGYDPNQLDEQFEALLADKSAPLLNRVTQGQYQPGLILQPFILAAAVENNLISLGEAVENANRPVPINGIGTRCSSPPPEPVVWADVLAFRCPGPMQSLADQLGIAGLEQIFSDFGLTTAPQFALNTEAPESEPLADPLLAGIGQDNLTVSPLQVGLALASLANDGRLPTPRLVTAVQDKTGVWQEAGQPVSQLAGQPVTASSARALRAALPQYQNVREYGRSVLSGPAGSANGWYLGLTNQYVVVIVVEESDDLNAVEAIGRGVVTAVATAP